MGAKSLRRGLGVLALSVLLVSNAVDGRAQPAIEAQSPPAAPAESLSTILGQIRAGSLLKLHSDGRKWMEGELIRSTDAELVLTPDRFEDVSIPYARVDSLWIAHGNRMHRGICWGMGIGAAVGAFTFYVLSPLLSQTDGASFNSLYSNAYSYAALGGVVGLGIGSGIGAWVGATTPGWKKLYPE